MPKERKSLKHEMRRVLIGLDQLICACWVGNDGVMSWRPMRELERRPTADSLGWAYVGKRCIKIVSQIGTA
ncbi:hypothetical protein HZ326_22017 [Fusarium oxysporum f. sp. albedinis]|nr:hypothetical protein HZ326_22017 [Fusarium oxysporum f. sp. albedinis]